MEMIDAFGKMSFICADNLCAHALQKGRILTLLMI